MEGVPEDNESKIRELIELKLAISRKDKMAFYERVFEFGSYLRKKYPDCEEYELFHMLIGSTLKKDHKPKFFDFPGEDSIEAFLRGLE